MTSVGDDLGARAPAEDQGLPGHDDAPGDARAAGDTSDRGVDVPLERRTNLIGS